MRDTFRVVACLKIKLFFSPSIQCFVYSVQESDQVVSIISINLQRVRNKKTIMTRNVVHFLFANEQLNEHTVTLIFDTDLSAYKGIMSIQDFKFPLLANLTKLKTLNEECGKSYEFMFSCNERDLVWIFLYEEHQKISSSKYKTTRLNENSICDLIYVSDCDEATLFFDGNKFDYIFQTDKLENSVLRILLSTWIFSHEKLLWIFTRGKLFYLLLMVGVGWIYQLTFM